MAPVNPSRLAARCRTARTDRIGAGLGDRRASGMATSDSRFDSRSWPSSDISPPRHRDARRPLRQRRIGRPWSAQIRDRSDLERPTLRRERHTLRTGATPRPGAAQPRRSREDPPRRSPDCRPRRDRARRSRLPRMVRAATGVVVCMVSPGKALATSSISGRDGLDAAGERYGKLVVWLRPK